jgi:hypothetical protein
MSVNSVAHLFGTATVERIRAMDAASVAKWYAESRPFLHPGSEMKLEVDTEARTMGVQIDRLEWFDAAIAALSSGGEPAQRAAQLLKRYSPMDAGQLDSPEAWKRWLEANRPYLFFSDEGDYRWYIDPLARKRGVSSSQLRGPTRASRP